ncbi:hypothetical protein CGRA01v4_02692 [Colletotrichum graminicola]|uniref:BTB domain-containing protein n=1 Tax=Colletotrichum graminicola (strain M1.001 / M2 / FGSC 10212) TaxID=645133 RepID=E3Q439_COLGM|nr:uncharacterized protein GLRG_00495 [Colletotrichum graminicola M1.001]EFQ25351.1 hypothetical protein GLRG_00495 [Colletotrichum graminicola M1.001]WDK11413.1 hypothetical protein CGRA01v4_02692 [Colletotrichum graminicola]
MASHHDAIDCSFDQGSSDDINPPPDKSTASEEISMATDTHTTHAEPIYPAGDLFVNLLSHENSAIAGFQLSSKVCSVASKTIATLIDTTCGTQDGRKVARLYDCVNLEVDAFRCIFSVLHYTNTNTYRHLPAKDLLQVAKVSAILDCGKALAPWICLWCDSIRQEIAGHDQPKTEELGMLLSSAITFKAEEEVAKLVAFASHHLPMNFLEMWARSQDLKDLHMNKSLNGLHLNVAKLFACTFELIHSIDGVLSSRSQVYTTGRKLCPSCGRRHPSTAKKCHPCHEIILWSELCTKQHRIGDYLRILTDKRLWPLNVLFKDDTSISQIVQRVTSMSLNISHACGGGTKCPLLVHINSLLPKVKHAVDGAVPGVEQGGKGKVQGDCGGDNGGDAAGSSNNNVAN